MTTRAPHTELLQRAHLAAEQAGLQTQGETPWLTGYSKSPASTALTLEEELWELLNKWASQYDDVWDLAYEAEKISEEWFQYWKDRQELYPQEELGGE